MRFVSSSYMFLDKKTLLKNWLNPGLTPEGGGGGGGTARYGLYRYVPQ